MQQQQQRLLSQLILLLGLWLAASACNVTKHLPEGQNLYRGSTVQVSTESKKNDKELDGDLKLLLRPKPNTSILGIRYKLWFYYVAGEPKGKGLRYFIRNKLGEPPVLAGDFNVEKNRTILQNRLENRGYFHARVEADTTVKGREMTAHFRATTGPQYKFKSIQFPSDSSELGKAIANIQRRSLLKVGDPYNLDNIRNERVRIDATLKNRGFYFFNPEYILVYADTTVGTHEVDARLVVKPVAPEKARHIYRINDIWVYPTYTVERDSLLAEAPSERYGDFNIIDPDHTFKPKTFERNLIFKPGDVYSRRQHNLSLNRLVTLGVFKFVKARFEEVDTVGYYLDPYYFLTPLPKKRWTAEITGLTKSNNATGSELRISWLNRNFLRGAELFSISAYGGIEQQVSGNVNVGTQRYGGEANLYIPRIVAPFRIGTNSSFVPSTRFSVAYEYFNRTDQYLLNSIRGSYGFVWKSSFKVEHQFNPIAINYVRPVRIDSLFQLRIDTDIVLARSIERQFIFGPNYNFNYTDLARPNNRLHNFYFNLNLDAPGNLLGLVTGTTFKPASERVGSGQLFNTPFSQYARVEAEVRHYLRLGKSPTTKLASRFLVGYGKPFGNSDQLPFIKAFFIGGTNSIRAFRARSLGPGTYYVRNFRTSGFLPDQPGDMKLELNTELRAKLVSVVHGAVFLDAGNIWTIKEDPKRPGSQFTNQFLNQLAVGGGVGIRVDITFIVLRLDLATPLRKPYLPDGPAWVFDQFQPGSAAWRRENLVLNIAIGYPF